MVADPRLNGLLVKVKDMEMVIAFDVFRSILPDLREAKGLTARYGTKGGLLLNVRGNRAGGWFDFSTNEHGDIIAFVQTKLSCGFKEAVEYIASVAGITSDDIDADLKRKVERARKQRQGVRPEPDRAREEAINRAAQIWGEADAGQGNFAEEYLRSRGIKIDAGHPAWRVIRSSENNGDPMMVLACQDALTGNFAGIQRIFADAKPDRPRKMRLGSAPDTVACIRFCPDAAELGDLGLAEGPETTLSLLAHGLHKSIWSSIDANGMRAFPVLESVRHLTLYLDNDRHNEFRTSEKAGRECKDRWTRSGREVTSWMPPDPGTDWLDRIEAYKREGGQ